jgi:hypothetical protein
MQARKVKWNESQKNHAGHRIDEPRGRLKYPMGAGIDPHIGSIG